MLAGQALNISRPLFDVHGLCQVFGWLIPSIFVGFVALSMAELTSSMP
jgi:amino acid transporter